MDARVGVDLLGRYDALVHGAVEHVAVIALVALGAFGYALEQLVCVGLAAKAGEAAPAPVEGGAAVARVLVFQQLIAAVHGLLRLCVVAQHVIGDAQVIPRVPALGLDARGDDKISNSLGKGEHAHVAVSAHAVNVGVEGIDGEGAGVCVDGLVHEQPGVEQLCTLEPELHVIRRRFELFVDLGYALGIGVCRVLHCDLFLCHVFAPFKIQFTRMPLRSVLSTFAAR